MNLPPNTLPSFAVAARTFLADATWLDVADEPLMTALIALGERLDDRISPGIVARFQDIYQQLDNKRPTSSDELLKQILDFIK
jgi:hypothetical protein